MPSAMVNIVGPKAGAHKLLHQISFLILAFGRAKAGKRAAAMIVPDRSKAIGGPV